MSRMLDSQTLYYASAATVAVMTLIIFLTWRANRHYPGTLLYIFFPLTLLAALGAFSLHGKLAGALIIPLAGGLFTLASVIHILALTQFLEYKGKATPIFITVTCLLYVLMIWFSLGLPVQYVRVMITDLQHLAEAVALIFLFFHIGRPHYPNGSLIYQIIALISLVCFGAHLVWVGGVERFSLGDNSWFAITLLVNGILAPMFYATGLAMLCNERRSQNLHQLTLKAQKDLEIRGLFLSTISHEIRTPLNGILGSAQLIMNKTSDPKDKPYCEAIINSAESLNLLIDKVLDYASLDQSDQALYEEDVEFKAWLQNLCLLLSPLAEQKKLTFELIYELPRQACYYCDQQKLRQVIINLVGNAIKFTDNGRVVLKVELLQENPVEHLVRFSVQDSGPGIEQDEIEYLTEPYVQSSAGKEKGGTGLGLAITSRLLERLGSQLAISSELGKGSSFSFDLRLVIGELSLVEQRHHSASYPTGLDVLLVEDLELNQKIAIEFMATDEHRIKLATTGAEAIALMQEYTFDVVLLDMNLPDLSGQEVLRRLKKLEHKNQRTPVLAFTASLSPDEVKEYLELGIADIVGKPIRQEKLRQALGASQSAPKASLAVELPDTLFDETATQVMAKSFAADELSSIYNEFVLSARNKLVRCQQLLPGQSEQCIKILHRQASTALQLGFNRYGLALKKVERRLLDGKVDDVSLDECLALWQQSLSCYLKYAREGM